MSKILMHTELVRYEFDLNLIDIWEDLVKLRRFCPKILLANLNTFDF